MSAAPADLPPGSPQPYRIVALNFVSLYALDFGAARDFYSRVFGAAQDVQGNGQIYGWQMGSTWLTLFPSKIGTSPHSNPRNTEFAIQVAAKEEVDRLHAALVEAGAVEFMAPVDTVMYEPMRFSCVDDPFGVRIDMYFPLAWCSVK